jgi:RNA polymerase sigma factor (TIGR02999 family)
MGDASLTPGRGQDLSSAVYGVLRAIAGKQMAGERSDHTLSPTALVGEAYLRMAGDPRRDGDPAGFYMAAAEAMRRILIDHARQRGAVKRGGRQRHLHLASVMEMAERADSAEIVAFDGALLRLQEEMPQAAAVVRLRFFAGLSVEQTAKALGLSERTVNREWTYARAWLFQRLRVAGSGDGEGEGAP